MKKQLPIAFTAPATISPDIQFISRVEISNPDTGTTRSVMALWDLGAGISVINESVATQLGLQSYGRCRLISAGGSVPAKVATATLQICIDGAPMEINVAIMPDRNDGTTTQLTIGTDVICRGCLSVFPNEDGFPYFSFAYPPSLGIDYHDFYEKLGQMHTHEQFGECKTK